MEVKMYPALKKVYKILKEFGPLSVAEIRQIADERGIKISNGMYPEMNIRLLLEEHIKKHGQGKPFIKIYVGKRRVVYAVTNES